MKFVTEPTHPKRHMAEIIALCSEKERGLNALELGIKAHRLLTRQGKIPAFNFTSVDVKVEHEKGRLSGKVYTRIALYYQK